MIKHRVTYPGCVGLVADVSGFGRHILPICVAIVEGYHRIEGVIRVVVAHGK